MRVRAGRAAAIAVVAAVAGTAAGTAPRAASPSVLLVGTYNGITGGYSSIQAAVNAAHPGDWVLVGPGDYHENGSVVPGPAGDSARNAGVLIQTPSLHLRGMNRNTVVVDGTRPGAARCSSSPADQLFGPSDGSGGFTGRNGIVVDKVDGSAIENLTVCNYLTGSTGQGNEVWWNGGDGTGTLGMASLSGTYLTASTSYTSVNDPGHTGGIADGQYGIFTSNETGPAVISHTYASNMADSAYYIGACRGTRPLGNDDCGAILNDAHAQNSALGFSGTNAGGNLVIQNGEFDHNKTGLAPNTLNNDDWPSPADGTCPNGGSGPYASPGVPGATSCTIIRNNRVHDNNVTSTPGAGIAAAGPTGTGLILSGVRYDTVIGNQIYNNSSWGVMVNDFPDTETPSPKSKLPCAGGMDLGTVAAPLCYYFAFGNVIRDNVFTNNGTATAPGTADIAAVTAPAAVVSGNVPGNCYFGNTDTGGALTSDPPMIETIAGASTCTTVSVAGIVTAPAATVQLLCGSSAALTTVLTCPNSPFTVGSTPQPVALMAIPTNEVTMPDPCAGVPTNPWCTTTAAAVSSGSGGLVNTGGSAAPAAAAAGAGILAVAVLGITARRRRR